MNHLHLREDRDINVVMTDN